MKKGMLIKLGLACFPVVAIMLNACGPVNEANNEEIALDQASDNWIYRDGLFSEWGSCNNAQDDDGDGLRDSHDPDCHLLGPVRDLSVLDFPYGHNFFPDSSKVVPIGPGVPLMDDLDFRDPELLTRWFRFLTEPDGNVNGLDIIGFGVNPEAVPVPAPLPVKIEQGTKAFGNNNNVDLRELHAFHLEHAAIVAPVVAAAANAPSSDAPNASSRYKPRFYKKSAGSVGGWPGSFYSGQGPFRGNGSQGGLQPADTGNGDGGASVSIR